MYLCMLLIWSLWAWASWGTFSPWGNRFSSVSMLLLMIFILAAMSSWRSMVLATLSSGGILSDEFLMSSNSLVACTIHVSIDFSEESNSFSSLQNLSTTSTVSLNCIRTASFSSTAFFSFSMFFFLSSGIVRLITSTLLVI